MTTYIDKVREGLEGALELRANVAESLMSTYANQPSARSAELEASAIEEGIREALSALQAHEAEVKELKRDAERYQWLRDGYDGTESNADRPVIVINRAGEFPKLDAAIDAALAKVKP